ncbi:glutaredoxin-C9-like [Quercus robur]|uniref:Glutaredoxin domain-containing protein n=1 Tax=Quercus lobata TaxID=97700 RepID=A0A7N2LR94_QUELO|nr:glutaredoxin-C9-like [Quercus lobata]XP_050290789.1 glutaredoxin-C9-like [Quercus robur]
MQVANKSGIRMESGIAMNTTVDSGPTHEVLNLESLYETVRKLATCNAVVVFSMSGCCMCTVAKRLLFGLGVGPTIIELDEHPAGHDIQAVLYDLCPDGQQSIPAIFIGGKFLGGIETLMACHINGSLVPLLKGAGALWL